jgi:hypothetical protein
MSRRPRRRFLWCLPGPAGSRPRAGDRWLAGWRAAVAAGRHDRRRACGPNALVPAQPGPEPGPVPTRPAGDVMPTRIETAHGQRRGAQQEAGVVPRTESATTDTAATAMTPSNALAHDLDPLLGDKLLTRTRAWRQDGSPDRTCTRSANIADPLRRQMTDLNPGHAAARLVRQYPRHLAIRRGPPSATASVAGGSPGPARRGSNGIRRGSMLAVRGCLGGALYGHRPRQPDGYGS